MIIFFNTSRNNMRLFFLSGFIRFGEGGCGENTGLGDEISMTEVSVKDNRRNLLDRNSDHGFNSVSIYFSRISFSSSGSPGLDPVPSLEALEMTVDLSGTPSMLPVPSFEPPVPGYLLLIFLLSLRAFIMSQPLFQQGCRMQSDSHVSLTLSDHLSKDADADPEVVDSGSSLFADTTLV
ncbi:hypothetical protein Tco_0466255 [Tanacetum coccineum]